MKPEERIELFTKYQKEYFNLHPLRGDSSDEERLRRLDDADKYAEERVKEDDFRESSMALCN